MRRSSTTFYTTRHPFAHRVRRHHRGVREHHRARGERPRLRLRGARGLRGLVLSGVSSAPRSR
jgi:hypothetical protein